VRDVGKGEGVWVNLGDVAEGPGPYTMSYGFTLDVLCESIGKAGVLNPPLVCRNEVRRWDVVSGYRRISALKALGEPKVFCRDVSSVLPSPLERLLANFYENVATRAFNDVEKAMVLERLQKHLSKEEILASFMPLLTLPSHQGTLELYLRLVNLEESVLQAVAAKEISMQTLKAFLEVDEASQRILFQNLLYLRLNFNQQTKFTDYIKDIAIRERIPILKVLCDGSFLEILENPKTNTPQKANAALELLRIRRYPRLAQAQRAVQSKVSAVPLPCGVTVHYDPFLEAPNYRIEICFKNGKDLKRSIRRLDSLEELEIIPDLWQAHESQD